jgi:hypothetical protein
VLLGSVAGGPAAPGLAPLLPATSRGLGPRVFSRRMDSEHHGPRPQLQEHAPAWGRPRRPFFKLQAFFTARQICADSDRRISANQGRGSRIALPAHRLHYILPSKRQICGLGLGASVDGRPPSAFAATCEVLSVITQRARMQQRPSSETASVSACDMCGLVLCGSSAGHSIGKTKRRPPSRIIPAVSHVAVCMPAARKEAI